MKANLIYIKIFKNLVPVVMILLAAVVNVYSQPPSPRDRQLWDFNWLFFRGGADGAEAPDYNDHDWRKVDIPHDWSIEDIPGTDSPFKQNAIGQVSTGFTEGGTGWYRKHFPSSPNMSGKRVYIVFEGIYMNADVWLNGVHLGNHPYGYTSFWLEITEFLQPNSDNVLVVQVKNEGQNSRWYSGSGIYRHVWLIAVDPLHVTQWGTGITTHDVSDASAAVHISTKIQNQTGNEKSATLITHLLDPTGREVTTVKTTKTIPNDSIVAVEQQATIQSPKRWSTELPVLYAAVIEVFEGDRLADQYHTTFGIRTISFDAKNGFQLNGKPVKLKGGCVHHDNGPIGSRAYDRAEERRVELLKASGYNAIRCAHNPPSPAFLEACDRLGMMVIDEAFDMWFYEKNPYDYHLYFNDWWQADVQSMVDRDRNHPSIILWSIGNEIPGMEDPKIIDMAKNLASFVHQLDPSRPITAAVNGVSEKKDPFFSALDVKGYNYGRDQYDIDHQRKPDRVMVGTESYALDAYDYWTDVEKMPWLVGDFIWTAFDYIGEASIGWLGYPQLQSFYPWTLAYCGDIDICGWKRPQSYYRDALWNKNGKVSIFVKPPKPSFAENPEREDWSRWHWLDDVADWTWTGYENKQLDVSVYSNAESVELLLNGKSLGRKPTNSSTRYIAVWQVPYQPGTLTANGYQGKKMISTATLRTAADPKIISLTPDTTVLKADGESLSYVTVELLDDKGVRNPKAENLVRFEVYGPGKVIAVASANPMNTESFQQMKHKAWQGKCLVVVKSDQSTGTITLKATSEGLKNAVANIEVK